MGMALFAGCAGPAKEDAKGQVDESTPPSIPSQSGKSDASTKTVAVDIQSPHPYANNANRLFSVPLTNLPSCAQTARLHFNVLRTEENYDFVTVEPTGEPVQSFDGNRDNTWTEWFDINATSVRVRLTSDYSITRHGFEIDAIEWDGYPQNCPAIIAIACADDGSTVDVTPVPGACECRQVPICEGIGDVEVSHHLARGFNNTTKTAAGAVALYTHPGPADGPETDEWGTVDTVKLAQLVRRAVVLGLVHGPGYNRAVAPGGTLDELRIRAGALEVTFVSGQGTHDAQVQSLIDEFEALFTCGNGGDLTCGAGYTCEQGACVEQQSCVCPALYDPVCSTSGVTYGNGCELACANAAQAHDGECGIPGDPCGTIMGLACQDDNKCRHAPSVFDNAPYPDAGGTCVARDYCDAPVDCNGLPHIAVPGAWACNQNTCAWTTGPTTTWQTLNNFSTTNPYVNNMSVWHQAYLPSGAQSLRLRSLRFGTELNYDKLEVWTWQNGAWTKVRSYTGSAGPALTDEFPGQYHYLKFVSDSSVTGTGVSVDVQYR